MEHSKNRIFAQKISFHYGPTFAIKNFSAEFSSGKFYGILGPNGCGKTTLLDLLIGSKTPVSGAIWLGGKPLSNYSRRDLAKIITLVPQQFDTGFGYNVEETVLMGRHPHIPRFANPSENDWQAVNGAISALDLEPLRDHFTTELSGGQKQRVVVARALAQECPIILFDEATASLDINHTIQIFNIAQERVKKGSTVIAVIHDLNLAAAYCDEILFLKEGHLLFEGLTKTTMTTENIAEIYAVESEVLSGETIRIHFNYGN